VNLKTYLKLARDLICTPDRLSVGHPCHTVDGEKTPLGSWLAYSWTPVAALFQVGSVLHPTERAAAFVESVTLVRRLSNDEVGYADDTADHATVIAVFDRAIAAAPNGLLRTTAGVRQDEQDAKNVLDLAMKHMLMALGRRNKEAREH
jgi:hypothetical protein